MSNIEPTEIVLPKPMSEKLRRRLTSAPLYFDDKFLYGNSWECTSAWYQHHFPGFSEETCKTLEIWSDGIRPKQYKSMLKKKCSASKKEAN